MRPLNLKISAFGPYADLCEIDMKQLGNRGLYLVTGDTGAGKSTIFDAISFALFGEPSGQMRESSQFRSKYASDDTPTFVELEFEYNHKIYYIKRNPSYLRKAKRGEGFTTQGADAELRCPDGEIYTKINDVNIEINQLLGINRDQFSQIVMLAQGDFSRLLTANTDERKEIFRHIFKTENFNYLQQELKNKTASVSEIYKQKSNSISQYFSDVFCAKDSPFFEELLKVQKNEVPFSQATDLICQIIDSDKLEYNQFCSELTAIQNNISNIEIKLAEHQKNIDTKTKLDSTTNQLSKEQIVLDDLSDKLAKSQLNKLKIEQLSAEIVTKTNLLENYDQLDQYVMAYQSNKKQLDIQTENIKISTLKKDKLSAEIAVENSALVPRETLIANTNSLIHKQEELAREKTEFLSFKQSISDLENEQKKLNEIKQNYLEFSAKTEQLLANHQSANKHFLDAQAGILAEKLLPNTPCSVCGSTVHPNKAVKQLDAPSKEQVDQLFEQYNESQNKTSEISQKASILTGKCDKMHLDIENFAQDFHISTDFCNLSTVISDKISKNDQFTADISIKLNTLQTELNSLAKIAEQLPIKQQQLELLTSEIVDLKLAHATLTENQDGVVAMSKKLRSGLDFDTKKQATQYIAEITQNRDSLQAEIDNLTSKHTEQKASVDSLFARKKTLTEQLQTVSEIDITAETQLLHSLNADKTKLSDTSQTIFSRMSSNQKALENLNTQKTEIDKVESTLTMISTLSKTANGNLSGKEKIALETYVQMYYFDRVLRRANQRFKTMTDEKYKLVRKIGSDKNNRQSGLDIDVFDYYNGTTRSIKTLSGGETFKASLSLALGLSDEIMSSAGGIKIDTMFVDEGFGSLDEQSLNNAIKVLIDLCKGDRLVGIISHVAELKDKIDNQIVVKKQHDGCSKITLQM